MNHKHKKAGRKKESEGETGIYFKIKDGRRTGYLKENMEEGQNEEKWDGKKDDIYYVFVICFL
jgi:hypothetical protein